MVDLHGSQCGFCTPGFVMSLYALWMRDPSPSEAAIEEALQGNLCRCTGYRPIVDAAKAVEGAPDADPLVAERARVRAALDGLDDGARVDIRVGDDRVVVPASADDLAAVLEETPGATIVAGSTDVGLWITKFMRTIAPAVFIAHLRQLQGVSVTEEGVRIGAGVSYDAFQATLDAEFPHLSDYWRRIGGWQVRVMGTVGGNVANGSPIGDTPPALIALGATVTLRKGAARRTLPLEAFFIAYGKQDREPGEFVEEIFVPRPPAGSIDAAYKVTKRRDEDISAVAAGFQVVVEGGRVLSARLAYGGMAATPKRAAAAEAALVGEPWTLDTMARAEAALAGGLPAAHRLARLGRLSPCGGSQSVAALLSGTGGGTRPPGPGGGGLMDTKLDNQTRGDDPRRGPRRPAPRQRPQARHRRRRVYRRHRRAGGDAARLPRAVGQGPRRHRGDGPRSGAQRAGVVGVLTADEIPGDNDLSQMSKRDEPVFARDRVQFHGQPLFAVVAETRDAARRAAKLARVEYRPLPHTIDVADAVKAGLPYVTEPLKLERGDVEAALATAPNRLRGTQRVGGQDHFYLEGQISFAVPGEDDDVIVYCSTQHPSEVQHMVAHVL